VVIRPLLPPDVRTITEAFTAVGWPGKPVELYRRYLTEQAAGERLVRVAEIDGGFAGYLCVRWHSEYEPFRLAGVPEITDLNVLPQHRRRGIATRLMEVAEAAIAQRSPVVGLGCGLYADYGPAMLLYLRRGYVPDGRGVAYRGRSVVAGQSIAVDDSAVLMLTKRLR